MITKQILWDLWIPNRDFMSQTKSNTPKKAFYIHRIINACIIENICLVSGSIESFKTKLLCSNFTHWHSKFHMMVDCWVIVILSCKNCNVSGSTTNVVERSDYSPPSLLLTLRSVILLRKIVLKTRVSRLLDRILLLIRSMHRTRMLEIG